MPNAWLNHVRQFRKQNRHLSYKQLLREAKNSYGGGPIGVESHSSLKSSRVGGGITGDASRSSLTDSATPLSAVGGGAVGYESPSPLASAASTLKQLESTFTRTRGGKRRRGGSTLKQLNNLFKGKVGGRKSRRRRR